MSLDITDLPRVYPSDSVAHEDLEPVVQEKDEGSAETPCSASRGKNSNYEVAGVSRTDVAYPSDAWLYSEPPSEIAVSTLTATEIQSSKTTAANGLCNEVDNGIIVKPRCNPRRSLPDLGPAIAPEGEHGDEPTCLQVQRKLSGSSSCPHDAINSIQDAACEKSMDEVGGPKCKSSDLRLPVGRQRLHAFSESNWQGDVRKTGAPEPRTEPARSRRVPPELNLNDQPRSSWPVRNDWQRPMCSSPECGVKGWKRKYKIELIRKQLDGRREAAGMDRFSTGSYRPHLPVSLGLERSDLFSDTCNLRLQLLTQQFPSDPGSVYMRLANFAARRRCLRRRPPADDKSLRSSRSTSKESVNEFGFAALSPYFLFRAGDPPDDQVRLPSTRPATPNMFNNTSAKGAGMADCCNNCSFGEDGEERPDIARIFSRRTSVESEYRDDQSEFAGTGEELEEIERLLEEMNSAAEVLNIVQESRKQIEGDLRQLAQLWAVGSARLCRAVGAELLAKASPYFVCKRRCKELQTAVEAASNAFMTIVGDPLSQNIISDLMSEHADCIKQYESGQRTLEKLRKKVAPSLLEAVAPYFDAEDDHLTHVSDLHMELRQLAEESTEMKIQYKNALVGLEVLSERVRSMQLEGAGTAKSDECMRTPAAVNCRSLPLRRSTKFSTAKPTFKVRAKTSIPMSWQNMKRCRSSKSGSFSRMVSQSPSSTLSPVKRRGLHLKPMRAERSGISPKQN